MMRYLLTILLLFVSVGVFARKSHIALLGKAMAEFDSALLSRDTVSLKRLLNDKLTYGHSNGWIQGKKEVIGDLYNGKIIYKKINLRSGPFEVAELEKKTALVRLNADIEVEMNGKPVQVKLSVLQVWQWKNKHWELFARQSVKI